LALVRHAGEVVLGGLALGQPGNDLSRRSP
jgi:hypothetical protein